MTQNLLFEAACGNEGPLQAVIIMGDQEKCEPCKAAQHGWKDLNYQNTQITTCFIKLHYLSPLRFMNRKGKSL